VKIHFVKQGDTLAAIARKYGIGEDDVRRANPRVTDWETLSPGAKVVIPDAVPVRVEPVKPEPQKPSASGTAPKEQPKPPLAAETDKKPEKQSGAENVAGQSQQKPVNKPAENIAGQSQEKPVNQPAENIAGQSQQKPVNKPAENVAGQLQQKPVNQPAENVADQFKEKPINKPAENIAGQSQPKPADKPLGTAEAPKVNLLPKKLADEPFDGKKDENVWQTAQWPQSANTEVSAGAGQAGAPSPEAVHPYWSIPQPAVEAGAFQGWPDMFGGVTDNVSGAAQWNLPFSAPTAGESADTGAANLSVPASMNLPTFEAPNLNMPMAYGTQPQPNWNIPAGYGMQPNLISSAASDFPSYMGTPAGYGAQPDLNMSAGFSTQPNMISPASNEMPSYMNMPAANEAQSNIGMPEAQQAYSNAVPFGGQPNDPAHMFASPAYSPWPHGENMNYPLSGAPNPNFPLSGELSGAANANLSHSNAAYLHHLPAQDAYANWPISNANWPISNAAFGNVPYSHFTPGNAPYSAGSYWPDSPGYAPTWTAGAGLPHVPGVPSSPCKTCGGSGIHLPYALRQNETQTGSPIPDAASSGMGAPYPGPQAGSMFPYPGSTASTAGAETRDDSPDNAETEEREDDDSQAYLRSRRSGSGKKQNRKKRNRAIIASLRKKASRRRETAPLKRGESKPWISL